MLLNLLLPIAAPLMLAPQQNANPNYDGSVLPPTRTTPGGSWHGVTGYTDRDDWAAAAGGTPTLVDFNALPDVTQTNGTGALAPWGIADTSGTSAFSPTFVEDQFVYSSATMNFPMFVVGTLPSEPNYFANRRDFPGAACTGTVLVEYDGPRTACGAYVADQSALGNFEIEIFDAAGASLGVVFLPPRNLPSSFAGIVSSMPFVSAEFRAAVDADSWGLDDMEYVGGGGIGTNYCVSVANSTGAPAIIAATGSTSLADNDLTLTAGPVPNQPFLFFHAADQAQIPFGNGFRCAINNVVRLEPVMSATGNVASRTVNVTTEVGVLGQRNFQCWYRDPAGGGAFFNLSDAVAITFVP